VLIAQQHGKAFQVFNDQEMYAEFCKLFPEHKEIVSFYVFRKFKPWWIFKPEQK
jgi:hypothetical protein